ncbi:MAG: rhomboid family intramembrane serine protease [Alphaproteobacteria bacterium]
MSGHDDDGGDEPGLVVVRYGLAREDAEAALLALAALGIPGRSTAEPGAGAAIVVGAEHAGRALEVLAELDEERGRDSTADVGRPRGAPDGRPWLDRSSLAVAGLLAVLVATYLATAGFSSKATWEQMLRAGAIDQARVERGESWRLLAAILLHFDVEHLLANAATLLFVGPLLAREIGGVRLLVVFVLSGLAGNLASFALAPSIGLKAGASGGIAGLLGALAGESMGAAPDEPRRFRRWQVLAAVAALYAFLVGASPRADHVAHAAGLFAGIALGSAIHPRARRGSRDWGERDEP